MRSKNTDVRINTKFSVKVPQDTDIHQLVKWWRDAGIVKAVIMGQDMSRIWNNNFGEDYVLDCYREYPDFFIPFASIEAKDKFGRFDSEKLEYLERAVDEYGFKGVLFTPPYGHFASNDPCMYPFYSFAQKRDIIVQFHHSGQMGPSILAPTKYAMMTHLNDVIIDFPDMKIVVEHLGYPWCEHFFVLMGSHKNMYTDLAMTFARPTWLTWQLVMAKEYGIIDRVMFASDYVAAGFDLFSDNPTQDLKNCINFIQIELNKQCEKSGWPTFTQEELDGMLYGNAAKLFSI